jgi:glycosyltransferase involved in cell wall biosynthesis
MDIKYVLMIDIRSRVFSDLETQSRHEKYGELIAKTSINQIKLLILTRQTQGEYQMESTEYQFETLIIPKNIALLMIRIKSLAKELKKYRVVALICGDPWESYWLAQLLRIRIFPKSKIQVQLHGDFASPRWGNNSLKSRLRKQLINLKSKHISQIRLTSHEQFLSLSKRYKFDDKKVKIIPVPLNLPAKQPSHRMQTIPTFGLIGRLHKERGLDTFVNFAQAFYNYNNNVNFVVIGDGPQRRELESALLSSVPESAVSFLGELSGETLYEKFSSLDVLCSFAPTESYGRVAREALALGVPILARRSAGLDQLALEGADELIEFLPDKPTPENFISKGLASLRIKVPESYFQVCKAKSENSINQLIASWIEMVTLEN